MINTFYGFEVMENMQKQLTDKLLTSDLKDYPVGLFYGKMGLSIYLYHLSVIESNTEYQSMAEQLLDQILLHDLSSGHTIAVEDGLAGIGLGVTWLVKNQFVKGDLNEILEEIDNTIFRSLVFQENPSRITPTKLLHLTGYLYIRLKEQNDAAMRTLYQELIIKVLNMCYEKIDSEFLNETYTFSAHQYQLPILLWIFGKILEAGFYNDRIYKMIDTLQLDILSRFPLLHSNRLFLLWGILHLKPFFHHTAWSNYTQMLYREIRLQEILDNEMKGRNMFVSNGLSMIYILLHAINSHFPDYPIAFDPQTIYNRLQNSDAWSALIERAYFYDIHHGLLNGFSGVQLVLSHIEKHYLSNAKEK